MFLTICRYGLGVAFLAALLCQAPAQDEGQPPKDGQPPKEEAPKKAKKETKKDESYRQFFRQPESVADYWQALQFELNVGRPDLAAGHLRGLLDKKPTEPEWVDLEEEQGMTNILRLRLVPKWDDDPRINKQAQDNAEKLIQEVTAALEKHLSNQQRIAKYVKNLASGEPEERSYALKELYRSGARMMPALIDRLRDARDEERVNLLLALPQLGSDIMPPLFAALDINDRKLRTDLIEVIEKRQDRRAVPYLWYLAGSERMPAEVRTQAREALALLLRTPANALPAPKVALTEEANRYYRHQVKFPDPARVQVWRWDGKNLVSSTMTASKAEEYYGLYFAREALDLDPTYQPAQVVFLSLALEKAIEPLGLDQPLTKGTPAINELLATVNPDLVTAVLERALTEHRTAVILGAARTLGSVGDVRAQRPLSKNEPALVRALKYPDRRVQLVAADALLRIPGKPAPPATARLVEVLRRAAAAEPVSKVLIADGNRERAGLVADALRKAGFEPVTALTGRDALRLAHEAADIDAILIDSGITDPQLTYLVGQLRADMDVGLVPIFITEAPVAGKPAAADLSRAGLHRSRLAGEERAGVTAAFEQADDALRQLAKQYPKIEVMAATTDVNKLRALIGEQIAADMGRPFTDAEKKDPSAATADRLKRLIAERKDDSDHALLWLGEMARGELAGYDLKPATDTLIAALRWTTHSKEATLAAMDAVARLPGAKAQTALAEFVLDARRPPELRRVAASDLVRHIQRNGPMITGMQVKALESLSRAADADARLKGNTALVLGTLRPDQRTTGERLKSYTPAPPPTPAPAAKEKEKEKD
jgi:CheY-like chemotaxis protein